MKNYQIVITGIVAFSVGVMAGPGIQESIEYARLHKEKDILYSSQDSRFLNETNRDSYYNDLLARLGPPEEGIHKYDDQIKVGKANKMVLYTIASLTKSMDTRLRIGDLKGCEDCYNQILRLIEANPSIKIQANMKDVAIINYAHCLAGRAANLAGNFKQARARYEFALKELREIVDLHWLASYALDHEARMFIREKKYDKACENLKQIFGYQMDKGSLVYGGMSKADTLVFLTYLNLKIGDKENAKKYANYSLRFLPVLKESSSSENKNKKDNPVVFLRNFFEHCLTASQEDQNNSELMKEIDEYWNIFYFATFK